MVSSRSRECRSSGPGSPTDPTASCVRRAPRESAETREKWRRGHARGPGCRRDCSPRTLGGADEDGMKPRGASGALPGRYFRRFGMRLPHPRRAAADGASCECGPRERLVVRSADPQPDPGDPPDRLSLPSSCPRRSLGQRRRVDGEALNPGEAAVGRAAVSDWPSGAPRSRSRRTTRPRVSPGLVVEHRAGPGRGLLGRASPDFSLLDVGVGVSERKAVDPPRSLRRTRGGRARPRWDRAPPVGSSRAANQRSSQGATAL